MYLFLIPKYSVLMVEHVQMVFRDNFIYFTFCRFSNGVALKSVYYLLSKER